MTELMRLVRRYGFAAAVVALAATSSLEVALRPTPDAFSLPRWAAVVAPATIALPLLGHRRFPFFAPAGTWVLAAAVSLADPRLVTYPLAVQLAGWMAAFLLGQIRDPFAGRAGLVAALASSVLVTYRDPTHSTATLVFVPALFAVGWLAGHAVGDRAEQARSAQERADRAERERDLAARVAAAEERTRIARELHDIVAHAVSVMVLQTGAVRHRLPPDLVAEAEVLRGVETAGRNALAEMRRLLGGLRREDDDVDLTPQPGLDRLEALVADVCRAGLVARLRVEGGPAVLPAAVDLSAYRIVQEGLTNALRHARAERADVVLRFAPAELHIEVRDDGRAAPVPGAGGYGLAGVRERVRILGGDMSTGPDESGGFVLRARLPLEEPAVDRQ